MIHVGTSGFSYKDWRGFFYPDDIKDSAMLPFYASRLNCVEINSSFYAVPSRATIQSLLRRTPPRFLFAMKVPRQVTHEPSAEGVLPAFQAAVGPLNQEGRLAALLLQFPWSFRPSADAVEYLRLLGERMEWAPTVVEFRNVAWVRQETYDLLRELNFGFCCVDEPRLRGLMPPVAVVTSPLGYVRFHGCNAEKWWQHEQAYERYDYLYSEEELREWLPKVRELEAQTADLFVFFNNHYQGKAPRNAQMMLRLLELVDEEAEARSP